jgi:tetratricopeptide (TPR) repeat protein
MGLGTIAAAPVVRGSESWIYFYFSSLLILVQNKVSCSSTPAARRRRRAARYSRSCWQGGNSERSRHTVGPDEMAASDNKPVDGQKAGIEAMHSDVLNANPTDPADQQRLVDEIKERGNLALKAKRLQEAAMLYTKAIEVLPNHALYSNRSMVRASMKQYEGAVADADECIKLDASFAKGYYRKATALEKLKKYGPAYDAYKLCIENTSNKKDKAKMQESADKMYGKACKQLRDGEAAAPAPSPSAAAAVAKDRFKKGGESGGFGAGAAGSTTDGLNTAAAEGGSTTATKQAASSSVVVDDGDELDPATSGAMRGYKTLADGRKTSFFHTELSEEAKALLAKCVLARPVSVHTHARARTPPRSWAARAEELSCASWWGWVRSVGS